jgi:antitoxin HigA-1
MPNNAFAPIAPGEMLKEEFLAAYGLSQNRLAKAVGISPNRIAEIVNNRRRITADTALRLGLYFGNSPEFWMNLQTHHDLKMAKRNLKPADAKRIKAPAGGVNDACPSQDRFLPQVSRRASASARLVTISPPLWRMKYSTWRLTVAPSLSAASLKSPR